MDLSRLLKGHKKPAKAPVLPNKALLRTIANTKPTKEVSELQRIVSLPLVWDNEEAVSIMQKQLALPWGKMTLRPVQAEALLAAKKLQGLLGFIDVGYGKTLITWLLPVVMDLYPAVILLPPATYKSYKKEVEKYKAHFVAPDEKNLHIIPYSKLSHHTGTALLEQIKPALIVADEADKLKNPDSARTRRFIRYMQANPETRFCGLSGTLLDSKIKDVAHLSDLALRHNSPIPRSVSHIETWARCLEVDGKAAKKDWEYFDILGRSVDIPLSGYIGHERRTRARNAFFRRIRGTEGCVVTTSPSVGVSLSVTLLDEPDPPSEIKDMLDFIRETGEMPDHSDYIPDEDSLWRVERNLSLGFYYRWAWEKVGGIDEEWLYTRRYWHKVLRQELQDNAKTGYDSPLLVSNAIAREYAKHPKQVANTRLGSAWLAWQNVKDRQAPPTVPVWVSDYYIQHVKKLIMGLDRPTIVWYSSSTAIEEAVRELGYPIHGAGTEIPEDKAHTCFASITVHGTGKRLHEWDHNIVMEPPSSAKEWQQLMGRTHRAGQKSDNVEFWIAYHTEPFRKVLKKAREKAIFAQDMLHNPQKLISTTWKVKNG